MAKWPLLSSLLGKYTPDGRPRQIAGHAMPMVILGVFILWLGWFGFNAGSQLAATAGSPMTRVILNTEVLLSKCPFWGV